MINKKVIVTTAALFVLCSMLLGCSGNKQLAPGESQGTQVTTSPVQTTSQAQETTKTSTSESKPQDSIDLGFKNVLKVDELKLADSSYESIDKFLKEHDNVEYGWSNSKMYAVFKLMDEVVSGNNAVNYMWKVGDSEPYTLNGVPADIGSYYWSPNDSYLIFDCGTSPARGGEVYWTKSMENVESIGYLSLPVWSPDSKWIAMGIVKSIPTVVDTSLEGSSDMIIYNIETKERRMIEEGTSEYYLVPDSWDKDGILTYKRFYFNSGSGGEAVTAKPDTSGSKPVTYDDQKEVEQLITTYYKALEAQDFDAAAQCYTSQGKLGYERTNPKNAILNAADSLKFVSLESYIPPNAVKDGSRNAPTVYFNVTLDVAPNKYNNVLWEKGINRCFVDAVKENGKWVIYYASIIR